MAGDWTRMQVYLAYRCLVKHTEKYNNIYYMFDITGCVCGLLELVVWYIFNMQSSIAFLYDCDLDFLWEIHTVLLHIVQFAVIVPVRICVCVRGHLYQRQDLWVLQLSLSYFQRWWQASCLLERRPIIVWYFHWSKRVKNTNNCIFMVVTLHAGLLVVFSRNDFSGSHGVLVLSLDRRQTGRLGLWFFSGTSCFFCVRDAEPDYLPLH